MSLVGKYVLYDAQESTATVIGQIVDTLPVGVVVKLIDHSSFRKRPADGSDYALISFGRLFRLFDALLFDEYDKWHLAVENLLSNPDPQVVKFAPKTPEP